MSCLMNAWDANERELRNWLRGRLGNPHDAEDMLQDLFLKVRSSNLIVATWSRSPPKAWWKPETSLTAV